MTGILLAFLPVGLGVVMFMINRDYIMNLFQPGITRIMLIAAIVMEIVGFLAIRKILDIEV
jgi:tight adherence protein B